VVFLFGVCVFGVGDVFGICGGTIVGKFWSDKEMNTEISVYYGFFPVWSNVFFNIFMIRFRKKVLVHFFNRQFVSFIFSSFFEPRCFLFGKPTTESFLL